MAKVVKQNQPKHHVGKSKAAVEMRRKKIVKSITEGKTRKEAGIEAGLSPKTAESQVSQILSEPKVQAAFKEILDKAGVTDERIAEKISNLLDAKKTVSCVSGKDAGAGSVDFVDVDDNTVQLNTAKLASQLRGHLTEKGGDTNINGSVIVEIVNFATANENKDTE